MMSPSSRRRLRNRITHASMSETSVGHCPATSEGDDKHACDAPGDWWRFGRLCDGSTVVGGAREQRGAGGSWIRLCTGEYTRRYPRYLFGKRVDEPELLLEEPENPPR